MTPPPCASVVRPTLLYINFEGVIPAKAGIQLKKTGFRVKPGMTIKVKGLSTHYTRLVQAKVTESGYSTDQQHYRARIAPQMPKVRRRAPVPGVLFDVSALPFV